MSGKISFSSEANEAAEAAFRTLIGWTVAAQFADDTPNGDYKVADVTRDRFGFPFVILAPCDSDGFIIDGADGVTIDMYADGFEIEVY